MGRPRTEHLFMDPCDHCKGKWLPNCGNQGCTPAVQLRLELAQLEAQGKTDAQIRQVVVGKYGTQIVATPDARAAWPAYALPFAGLLLGALLIGWIGRRWIARGKQEAAERPPLGEEQREQVEAALKKLDP